MLSKPTNPTPYMVAIDATNDITFKVSCKNANEITGARLCIDKNGNKYYFSVAYTKAEDNEGVSITASKNVLKSGYAIWGSTAARKTIEQPICGNNSEAILKNQQNYSWQLRLYQSATNINIGYGFIQEKIAPDTKHKKFNSSTTCILKVRPHTNMFFNVGTDTGYNNGVSKEYVNYFDDKVGYTISINGRSYSVGAYYYQSSGTGNITGLPLEKDAYGNPLYAYIEISGDTSQLASGDQYSIYTNYIDSNEFYLPCRQKPILNLYDRKHLPITNLFADSDTPVLQDGSGKDKNVISIDYNEFKLSSEYTQADNASIGYYRIVLYKVEVNNEIFIHDTGNVYASTIQFSYDRFMANGLYKLVLQAVDTNQNTIVKSVYIRADYPLDVETDVVSPSYYASHASMILDFNDISTISPEEKIDGAHTYNTFFVDENGTIDDGSHALSDMGTQSIPVTSCSVAEGNTLTYSKIDGVSDTFDCVNPLLSVVVHGDIFSNGSQTIFTLTDDKDVNKQGVNTHGKGSNTYTLNWTGKEFILEYTRSGSTEMHRIWVPFNGYNSTSPKAQIQEELKKNTKNYFCPYLALEDLPTDEHTYYWHTEDIFMDFWWQIMLTQKELHIRCLNPPDTEHAGKAWEITTSFS